MRFMDFIREKLKNKAKFQGITFHTKTATKCVNFQKKFKSQKLLSKLTKYSGHSFPHTRPPQKSVIIAAGQNYHPQEEQEEGATLLSCHLAFLAKACKNIVKIRLSKMPFILFAFQWSFILGADAILLRNHPMPQFDGKEMELWITLEGNQSI